MKIIFSRKGFDSSAGGFPSLIFPNDTLYSVPIPGKLNLKKYCELEFKYKNYRIQDVLNDLTKKRIYINGKSKQCDYNNCEFSCHHDPYFIKTNQSNLIALGQVGIALKHLENQNVKKGDIFLFYGLFRKVIYKNNQWLYNENFKPIHLIFSYMKINEIYTINDYIDAKLLIEKYPFLTKHPHLDKPFIEKYKGKNKIFLGNECKIFDFHTKRILSDIDNYDGASKWKLPISFNFVNSISYIKKIEIQNKHAYLRHKGYGQEFVLNLEAIQSSQRKEFENYLRNIIEI